MAPSLALTLCVCFIAVLLFLDSRRRRNVSAAIWFPILLLSTLASRPPSLWFTERQASTGLPNEASGVLVDQLFFASLIAGCIVVLLSRRIPWGQVASSNKALLVFYAYFATSALWSQFPSDSMIRLLKDFGGTVIAAAVIMSEKDPIEAVKVVTVRAALLLFAFSVTFIRYFPQFGRAYDRSWGLMFRGVADHKNTLGVLAATLSLFVVWDIAQARDADGRWRFRLVGLDRLAILAMGLWLLNICQSKTSLVSFVLGTVLLFSGLLRSRAVCRSILVVVLSLPFFVLLTQQMGSLLAPLFEAIGRDPTFTGRADIWHHIDLTTVNPLVGAGFYNFWGGSGGRAIQIAMQTPVPNSHDGYLDIYLDGGFIGVALLFAVLLSIGNRLVNRLGDPFDRMRFLVLIVAMVHNLTESDIGRPSLLWFTTVLVLLEFPRSRSAELRLPVRVGSPGAGAPQPSFWNTPRHPPAQVLRRPSPTDRRLPLRESRSGARFLHSK